MSHQLPRDILTRIRDYKKPRRPTTVRPGPEKVPVMMARLRRGEHLRHPLDPEMDDEEGGTVRVQLPNAAGSQQTGQGPAGFRVILERLYRAEERELGRRWDSDRHCWARERYVFDLPAGPPRNVHEERRLLLALDERRRGPGWVDDGEDDGEADFS
jgi:hypothetical protein